MHSNRPTWLAKVSRSSLIVIWDLRNSHMTIIPFRRTWRLPQRIATPFHKKRFLGGTLRS
jgi:hypothetical protein